MPMMSLLLSLSVTLSTMAPLLLPSMSLSTVGSWNVVSVSPMPLLLPLLPMCAPALDFKLQHQAINSALYFQYPFICKYRHESEGGESSTATMTRPATPFQTGPVLTPHDSIKPSAAGFSGLCSHPTYPLQTKVVYS